MLKMGTGSGSPTSHSQRHTMQTHNDSLLRRVRAKQSLATMLMGEDPVISQNNTIRRSRFIEDPTVSSVGLSLTYADHKHNETSDAGDSTALGKLGRFIGAFDPLNAIRAVHRTYKKVKGEPAIADIENDDRLADANSTLMSTGCDPLWEGPENIEKSSLSRTFSMATLRRARSELSLFPRPKLGTPSATPSKRYSAESISNASVKSIKHQKKLTKRISDLETQLELARRELHSSINASTFTSSTPQETYTPKFKLTQPRTRTAFIPGSLPTLPSESLLFPNMDKPLPSEPPSQYSESYKYLPITFNSLEDPFVSPPNDPTFTMSSFDGNPFNDTDGPYTLKTSDKAPSERSDMVASTNDSEATPSIAKSIIVKRNDSLQEPLPALTMTIPPPSPSLPEDASVGSVNMESTAAISISSSPITATSSRDNNVQDRVSSRGSEIALATTELPKPVIKRKPVRAKKRRSLDDEDRTYHPPGEEGNSSDSDLDMDVGKKRKRRASTGKRRGSAKVMPKVASSEVKRLKEGVQAQRPMKAVQVQQLAKVVQTPPSIKPVQTQQSTKSLQAQHSKTIAQAEGPAEAILAQQPSTQLIIPPEPSAPRRSFEGQVGALEVIEEEQSSVACSSPVVVRDFAIAPKILENIDQASQVCSTSDVMESVERDQGDPAKVDRMASISISSGVQESILSKNGKQSWDWPDFVF